MSRPRILIVVIAGMAIGILPVPGALAQTTAAALVPVPNHTYIPDFVIVGPPGGSPPAEPSSQAAENGHVIVTGAVRNPRTVNIGSAMSALEALIAAGSARSDAGNEVLIIRAAKPDGTRPTVTLDRRALETGASGRDLLLENGDIVSVPFAKRFWINGLVANPGNYVIDIAQTVGQAIMLAGGLTGRGSDGHVTITRAVNGRLVTNAARMSDRIEPDDIITVGARRF